MKSKVIAGFDGKHHFTVVAENGVVLLTSKIYSSRTAAKNGLASLKKNCEFEMSYEIHQDDKAGKYHFNIKSKNNALLATSPVYKSMKSLNNAINNIQRDLVSSRVEYWSGPGFHDIS